MNVLMIATWYSPKNAEKITAGIFHYEQSMALKPFCNTALYFPYDKELTVPFEKNMENGLLTYRRRDFKFPKLGKLQRMIHVFKDLRRICKEYKPDILHAHCASLTGAYVAFFGKIYGYPVVITEHSPMEHLPLKCKSGKKALAYAYSHSDANVCVSSYSMKQLEKEFPDCHFQLIYNGIYSPKSIALDGFSYSEENKINCCIVASFYSLDIKGYQFLLPAIAQLKQSGEPILLHICGGGTYLEQYKNMARDLDILDYCVFYGDCSKSQVYSIISQMDFCISASLYESAGVSVEEALLLGKPMLVTMSGGANSLVNEENAIIVDKGSTAALVSGILKMIERLPNFSPARIAAYGAENFDIDSISKQYMNLYEHVIAKKQLGKK